MTNKEWEQIVEEFRNWHNKQDWNPTATQVGDWFKQRLVVDAPNPPISDTDMYLCAKYNIVPMPNTLVSDTECKNYEPKHEDNKLCKWCGKGKYTHV